MTRSPRSARVWDAGDGARRTSSSAACSPSRASQRSVALRPGAVLVWRHGSAFPAEAWKAISEFLEAGGNLLAEAMHPVQMTKKVRVRCGKCSTVNVSVIDGYEATSGGPKRQE